EGEYFLKLISELLEAKKVRTFRDLVHPDYADQPRYRYKVRVIASDITDRQLLVLPQDAIKFGIHPDDLNVALALRMSMSIPIFSLGVSSTDFHLSGERIIDLYQSGRTASLDFLRTWDFDGYIAEFRSGKEHHRRQIVAEEISEGIKKAKSLKVKEDIKVDLPQPSATQSL